MDVQHLFLTGRATDKAQALTSKKEKSFTAFSLATNRYLGKDNGNETTYYECLVFNPKQAEKAVEAIEKGDTVIVHGRPTADAYLSTEGEAKARISVIVESWKVLK